MLPTKSEQFPWKLLMVIVPGDFIWGLSNGSVIFHWNQHWET